MSRHETVLIFDFGSQYTQLIARRVRELGVYCEVLPFHDAARAIRERAPRGVILSGGPDSVYADGAPHVEKEKARTGSSARARSRQAARWGCGLPGRAC